MVRKNYQWADGAVLEDHSRCKLKILREYFADYLAVRCVIPQQERFRIAIVDGFAGGGRYKCGAAGSPIVFIEELKAFTERIRIKRAAEGMAPIAFECLLILNDEDRTTLELLETHVAPLEADVKTSSANLHLRVEYFNKPFEKAYAEIAAMLQLGRFSTNVLFNLDQCGHKGVSVSTLLQIMRTYSSAEIFYTFAIQTLISFLEKANPTKFTAQLAQLGLSQSDLLSLQGAMNREVWLAAAERIVFEHFGTCAPYVSPFSIHNPKGWRYWLIHFANSYRARQVYNNVLHQNYSAQAHFGRSGLNMLSFNPAHKDGRLYLFDTSGRKIARDQLLEDIPRLISDSGDAIGVGDFYSAIYNKTPAHTDDVHSAIIDNPDIEVITPVGGERRKANTISVHDVLKLKDQKSFFPIFFNTDEKKKP